MQTNHTPRVILFSRCLLIIITITHLMRAISAEHCAYKESEVPVSHRGTSWSFSINLQSVLTQCQGLSSVVPQ